MYVSTSVTSAVPRSHRRTLSFFFNFWWIYRESCPYESKNLTLMSFRQFFYFSGSYMVVPFGVTVYPFRSTLYYLRYIYVTSVLVERVIYESGHKCTLSVSDLQCGLTFVPHAPPLIPPYKGY